MTTVKSQTLGECWQNCVARVLSDGHRYYDEDVALLEILGMSVEISHPSPNDTFIARVGDKKVIDKMIEKFSKGVTMEDRPFTYGQLIFDMNGIDQFEWMIKRLESKLETKSATISLIIPGLNTPNLPCLSTLDAKIRDRMLHLQFFFRSQNIFGRQYANLLALASLHKSLADRMGCALGSMRGYIASAHIYEYDVAAAKELVDARSIQVTDHYYTMGPKSIRS